jgi:hypothetical protein
MRLILKLSGTLAGLWAIGQFLQLLGVVGVGVAGVGPVMLGVSFTVLGGAASYLCFKKALAKPNSGQAGVTGGKTTSTDVTESRAPQDDDQDPQALVWEGKIGRITRASLILGGQQVVARIPLRDFTSAREIRRFLFGSIVTGILLIFLPLPVLRAIYDRVPPGPVANNLFMGLTAGLNLIGLCLTVRGFIGKRYLHICWSDRQIEIECDDKGERKSFIAAISSHFNRTP